MYYTVAFFFQTFVGRKEIAKINSSKAEHGGEEKGGGEESGRGRSSLSRGLSTVWNFMTALTRDYVTGPPTNIHDCLNAFFDASELRGNTTHGKIIFRMRSQANIHTCTCNLGGNVHFLPVTTA